MTLLKISAVTGLFILMTSCSSVVQFRVQKAPQIAAGNQGATLVVEDPDMQGQVQLEWVDMPGGLKGALGDLVVQAGMNQILVTPAKNQSFARYASQTLERELMANGHYKLQDKNAGVRLQSVWNYKVADEKSSKEQTLKDGSKVLMSVLERTARVDMQLRVVNAKGELLGAKTLQGNAKSVAEGSTAQEARRKLADWESLVQTALGQVAPVTVRMIAPYWITQSRTLAKGESDRIKKGNKAAEKGDWTKAVQYWNQEIQSTKNVNRAAAKYNLAIYQESQDRLDESLALLLEARQIKDEDDWFVTEQSLRERIAEANEIKALMAPAKTEETDKATAADSTQGATLENKKKIRDAVKFLSR